MRTEYKRREINGTPYIVEENEWGYGVVAAESPTDRFHRSYQVYCSANGSPVRCSCPVNTERRTECKHMKEIKRLRNDEARDMALAEIVEAGQLVALKASPNYWAFEDHHKTKLYEPLLVHLRTCYREVKAARKVRDAVAAVEKCLTYVRTGVESNRLSAALNYLKW